MANELNKINALTGSVNGTNNATPVQKVEGQSFSDVLNKSIKEVNTLQQEGDKALTDMATGQVKDLHQAAIAINKAETSMKLMLEVRNKAISAYKEILRTQV